VPRLYRLNKRRDFVGNKKLDLNEEEIAALEEAIEASYKLSDVLERDTSARWLRDGDTILMNFMFINFWFIEVKYYSGQYMFEFGNGRKYREAKRRMRVKPLRWWTRFKLAWTMAKVDNFYDDNNLKRIGNGERDV